VAAVSQRLAGDGAGATLVATDGVFSMDGDVAPLRELAEACRVSDAWLFVDDAHGFGVLGPQGRGSVAAAGLGVTEVPILMCTLGKALGSFGAVVAGSQDLIDCLVQRGRTYIYTTALPPAQAVASRVALRLAREENWRREHLFAQVERFRLEAASMGLQLMPSQTPIQPLLLRDERAALVASSALLERGVLVTAIRPPTVPAGTSRLRITLSAAHADADMDRLLQALHDIQREGLLS
jgi:8-amino-7-oxononanoate synthase